MKNLKRFKSLAILSLTSVLLVGFTGQEKFVELEGFLNGRSSAAFRKIDTNVKAVLDKGTRGEILQTKKMSSGNYGLKVRVMSGPNTGRAYWIYYNVSNPDVALFDSPPQSWEDVPRVQETKVEDAMGVETVRATTGIDDTDKAADALYLESLPKPGEEAKDVINAIDSGNEAIKNVPTPTSRPECEDCNQEVESPAAGGSTQISIGRATRSMSPRCSILMDKNGELGRVGKRAMSIMSEKKYVDLFTKSNALGEFCPKFNRLDQDAKLQAWTWYWTALATEETQCIVDITHVKKTKTGRVLNPAVGYGLFAAEKDYTYRVVTQNRGKACAEISGALGQMLCAIDTMAKHTLREGQTPRSDSSGYWGPSRPYSSRTGKDRGLNQMMPHMKRFKACF